MILNDYCLRLRIIAKMSSAFWLEGLAAGVTTGASAASAASSSQGVSATAAGAALGTAARAGLACGTGVAVTVSRAYHTQYQPLRPFYSYCR